jgi:hypothetical protein
VDWAAQSRKARLDWRLYAVTDPRQNERWSRSNAEAVAAAIDGGVTVVQLREKDAEGIRFFAEAQAVIGVARPQGVRFASAWQSILVWYCFGWDKGHHRSKALTA